MTSSRVNMGQISKIITTFSRSVYLIYAVTTPVSVTTSSRPISVDVTALALVVTLKRCI